MTRCRSGLHALRDDAYLAPYLPFLDERRQRATALERRLTAGTQSLVDFASAHEYYGLHFRHGEWVFREWAPNATSISMLGTFSGWKEEPRLALRRVDEQGTWEVRLPADRIRHGDLYRLRLRWNGGEGDRIPAYARRVVQDENTQIFNAQVWRPATPYAWKHAAPAPPAFPLVYEMHVGMAQERPGVGTYAEFRRNTLPRVVDAGYNTLQAMAIMEHPYYGSFGYHVSSFFAASSRFGTPEELKELIDATHEAGLLFVMDLVHSHAVNNEVEGLSRFDGTPYLYFHEGSRGFHAAWDSRCFDYGKIGVLHFLLSNCRFWLDEYRVDGFRFDGVTSMLYLHHGLGPPFTSYDRYFDGSVDDDAVAYLTLANNVIHAVRPDAVTIAEDVSGMPGLAAPPEEGGCGFDYRLAMGVPDCWFKLIRDVRDEDWNLGYLWSELNNRREDERTISYVESHDQALVGGKTAIFSLIDKEMYSFMRASDRNLIVERGIALHKLARLATVATAGHGYLTFMGNEFGHPEWIDFPRRGNNWSYHYCRRQWHLRDDPNLKYHFLADFDREVLRLFRGAAAPASSVPCLMHLHNDDKILAFARGSLVFVFNLHPTRSFENYGIPAPPGEYALVMDSDEERFGGLGRIAPAQRYIAIPVPGAAPDRHQVLLYLPARTALVLRAPA